MHFSSIFQACNIFEHLGFGHWMFLRSFVLIWWAVIFLQSNSCLFRPVFTRSSHCVVWLLAHLALFRYKLHARRLWGNLQYYRCVQKEKFISILFWKYFHKITVVRISFYLTIFFTFLIRLCFQLFISWGLHWLPLHMWTWSTWHRLRIRILSRKLRSAWRQRKLYVVIVRRSLVLPMFWRFLGRQLFSSEGK